MARLPISWLSIIFVATAGCQSHGRGTEGSDSSTASPSAAVSSSPPAAARRLPLLRRQGFAGLAFNSAGELPLSDDQVSTLKKLEDDFEPLDRDVRSAHDQFEADLSAALRSGTFDDAKLKDDEAAIDRFALAAQAYEVGALDGLYAALDPDERSDLVAAVRAREAAFQTRRSSPPDSDARVAAAQRNDQTLDRMSRDLTLDTKQQRKVADLLAKEEGGTGRADSRDEMLRRLDLFLTAFDKPGFDAQRVDLTDSKPHAAQGGAAFLQKLAPILTRDQREKLAAARSRRSPIYVPAGH
jgi:Spy/CpxP family protein refolding chaperone